MVEISNKTIVSLLAIALVITIAGTIISVSNLTDLSKLTGAATSTQTGHSNLTLNSVTSITQAHGSINFGAGYVNQTNTDCNACVMSSEDGIGGRGNCCISFTNTTHSGFLIENTGNVNLSIQWNCTGGTGGAGGGNSCEEGDFIGNDTTANTHFRIWALPNLLGQNNNDSSIDTERSCINESGITMWTARSGSKGDNLSADRGKTLTYGAVATVGGNFSSPVTRKGGWLCGNLTYFPLEFGATKDAGVVHLNVSIDQDLIGDSRERNATFTFTGHSSG
jgi:hypothetical protein